MVGPKASAARYESNSASALDIGTVDATTNTVSDCSLSSSFLGAVQR